MISFASICKEFQLPKDDKVSGYTHISQKGGKYNFRDDAPLEPINPTRARFVSDFTRFRQRPPTEAEYMYAMLARWWATRTRASDGISLISKRTNKFFLYFDLDIKFANPGPSTWSQFQTDIAGTVFAIVARSFQFPEPPEVDRELQMTVCTTVKPRYIVSKLCINGERVEKEVEKWGMHLYFPTIVVSFQEAMMLVDVITQEVRESYGERDLSQGENAWNDVIDASVYRTGLRDCFTFKVNSCRCFDFSSYYVPTCVVTRNGSQAVDEAYCREQGFLHNDINLTLYHLTRIRATPEDAQRFSFPMVVPNRLGLGFIPTSEEHLQVNEKGRGKMKSDPLQYPTDINAQRKFRNFEVLFFAPSDLAKIERCVRECFDEARYGQVQVRTVYAFLYKEKDKRVDVNGKPSRVRKIKITLKGPGSKYCFGKGAPHSNNTVYFELNVKGGSVIGLEQRCWSPKSFKRGNRERLCSLFTSVHINKVGRVPPSIVSLLFHSTQTTPDVTET